MSDEAMKAAATLLPGAVQAANSLLDYVFGLARTAQLSEDQARAELAPLYARLQKRADAVEAAPVFDPDAPRRPSGPSGVEPFPDPGPTAPDPTASKD